MISQNEFLITSFHNILWKKKSESRRKQCGYRYYRHNPVAEGSWVQWLGVQLLQLQCLSSQLRRSLHVSELQFYHSNNK